MIPMYGRLKRKSPLKHRYVAIVTYAISESEAKKAASEDNDKVFLDQENRVNVTVGCVDCEAPYSYGLTDIPCTGEEFMGFPHE